MESAGNATGMVGTSMVGTGTGGIGWGTVNRITEIQRIGTSN